MGVRCAGEGRSDIVGGGYFAGGGLTPSHWRKRSQKRNGHQERDNPNSLHLNFSSS
jgi:hypothetical protein